MSLYAATQPDQKFMLAAKADHPELAALALELAQDKTLHTLHRRGATTQETIADLWPRLLVGAWSGDGFVAWTSSDGQRCINAAILFDDGASAETFAAAVDAIAINELVELEQCAA